MFVINHELEEHNRCYIILKGIYRKFVYANLNIFGNFTDAEYFYLFRILF